MKFRSKITQRLHEYVRQHGQVIERYDDLARALGASRRSVFYAVKRLTECHLVGKVKTGRVVCLVDVGKPVGSQAEECKVDFAPIAEECKVKAEGCKIEPEECNVSASRSIISYVSLTPVCDTYYVTSTLVVSNCLRSLKLLAEREPKSAGGVNMAVVPLEPIRPIGANPRPQNGAGETPAESGEPAPSSPTVGAPAKAATIGKAVRMKKPRGKRDVSPALIPQTAEELLFFRLLGDAFANLGRKRPTHWRTVQQREMFMKAAERLGPNLENAINAGLRNSILAIGKLVAYVAAYRTKSFAQVTTLQGETKTQVLDVFLGTNQAEIERQLRNRRMASNDAHVWGDVAYLLGFISKDPRTCYVSGGLYISGGELLQGKVNLLDALPKLLKDLKGDWWVPQWFRRYEQAVRQTFVPHGYGLGEEPALVGAVWPSAVRDMQFPQIKEV